MLRKDRRGQCQGLGRLHLCLCRAGGPKQVVEVDIKPRSGSIAFFSNRGQVGRHSSLFLSLVESIHFGSNRSGLCCRIAEVLFATPVQRSTPFDSTWTISATEYIR